jgi:hypothetical protein
VAVHVRCLCGFTDHHHAQEQLAVLHRFEPRQHGRIRSLARREGGSGFGHAGGERRLLYGYCPTLPACAAAVAAGRRFSARSFLAVRETNCSLLSHASSRSAGKMPTAHETHTRTASVCLPHFFGGSDQLRPRTSCSFWPFCANYHACVPFLIGAASTELRENSCLRALVVAVGGHEQ